MWLRTGGSAGHAGLHHLNVFEGKRGDVGGRQWKVEVLPATEGNKRDDQQREQQKEAKTAAKVQAVKEKIIKAMMKTPDGDTEKAIRTRASLDSGQVTRTAFAELLDASDIEECDIQKQNRKKPYPGFKLKDRDA